MDGDLRTRETIDGKVAVRLSGGDRELLVGLLEGYETVDLDGAVPPGTDLCVVDERGLAGSEAAIVEWKREQRPRYAPVLLLADADVSEAWQRHAQDVGSTLDALQPVPAPRAAIRARVDALVESRRHSVLAQERREQLELYERAMDGANVGITIADATRPDHPLVYANEGFCEITGYEESEVLGRNCRFLQGEETDPETVAEIRTALDAERPVSVEIYNYRRSGEPFWNALDIMPVRDDGSVTHFLGFQRDITADRQREALLEQYERIVQSVEDPVFVVDEEGKIVSANDALRALLDAPPGALIGTEAAALFAESEAQLFEAARHAVVETGRTQQRELPVRSVTGREAVLQFQLQREHALDDSDRVPPTDADGDRVVVVSRDVTELREDQARLSVLDRVLRHNIRNKMNVILGHEDVIDGAVGDPERVRESAALIRAAAEDLLALSDMARRFNRSIDSTQDDTVKADVVPIVRTVVSALAEDHPSVTIETDLPDHAPVRGPSTLESCIEQLIESAIEHSDRPDPTVRVAIAVEDDGVEFRVVGEEPGVPSMERRVLNRGTERPLEHAEGIGLWLVRWAITSSGGRLHVDGDGMTTVVDFRPAQ